ncbi:MAG: thioredoxin-disulfide reductase [Halobacteria archaeon]|nr:thioredoxin-disulfide reductase [Halobacteria archaeon]
MTETHDVVVAGSGMAGLTAAIYAARADLEPLVLEGDEPGGQLTLTTDVENYPGFSEGVDAFELIEESKEQAARFGAEYMQESVVDTDADDRPITLELSNGDQLETRAFIVASGASARWVGAENEDEMMGHGLSTCATCDGAFHRGDTVLVIGGGDSAMEEALFLTKFADEVHVVHRRDELRASEIMKKRAMDNDKIEFMWNTELLEIYGSQDEGVTGAKLVENEDGHPKEAHQEGSDEVNVFDFDCGGVFYAIGHTPNTEFLEGTGVEMDEDGYINTVEGRTSKTEVEGIFAAGDVSDRHYQQAVTAAGMGCMAAIDAEEWLDEMEAEDEKERATAD